MTLCTKTNWFAKFILAGLGGTAGLGLLAAAALAQPAMMPASRPLYFEANRGQADSAAQFIARGRDYQFLISPDSAQFVLVKTTAPSAFSARAMRMQFVGANGRAQISGAEELPGKINYLVGNNPARWQTGVGTFARVRVAEIYPGISLTYYGNQRQLEYDFNLAPAADPGVITIHFEGADKISVSPAGELVLNLGDGEIRQPRPDIYQTVHGARKEISGGYKLLDAQTVAFAVADYDRSLPLVIDPILSYSTYFGGLADDVAFKVAVDTNGFVYVAGETFSANLATAGAIRTNYASGAYGDAFVAKFSNDGSNLVYCTYLGGSVIDFAYGLAVDNAGDVFLTGCTDSPDFPTNNALYPNILGHSYYSPRTGTFYNSNAFVTELDPTGSHLIYSTYLGGSGNIPWGTGDGGIGIAVDAAGNAYITGITSSTNFPTTNALSFPTFHQLYGTNYSSITNFFSDSSGRNFFSSTNFFLGTNWLYGTNAYYSLDHLSSSENTFVTKIGPGGTNLIFSTYFYSSEDSDPFTSPQDINLLFPEAVAGIAVDGAGSAYITGAAGSSRFFVTTNASGVSTNLIFISANNAFVAKFGASGTNLVYWARLGGTNNDQAFGIAVDAAGNAYVTGGATSPDFPVTSTNIPNGLTNNLGGLILTTNAFLAKLDPTGSSLVYSAVFGGLASDVGYGVALDPAGDVFVCGASSSANFPVTTNNIPDISGCLRATNSGGSDAFVIAFTNDFSSLIYSAYLGGAANDFGYGIAVDPAENAYVVGQTLSANFRTNHALHAALNGPSDAFLAKIFLDPPMLALSAKGARLQVGWGAGLPFEPELPRLFRLESSTDLFSTNWVPVPQPPVLTNNSYGVMVSPTNKMQFFRLHAF